VQKRTRLNRIHSSTLKVISFVSVTGDLTYVARSTGWYRVPGSQGEKCIKVKILEAAVGEPASSGEQQLDIRTSALPPESRNR
jgi:hypothetical protein